MQMNLQESITTWFKKPTMDPTRNPNSNPKLVSHAQYQNDPVSTNDYEDRLSANESSDTGQIICHHHVSIDREPMFEKPLTPSDVGKLNRLVIPKQHAEEYFPLGGGSGSAAGTLLGFEDEAGECWRFRYSYWNSSQSYVLTKGWSRYVKDKRLDAGDVVFFERQRAQPHRLFIGWRRRPAASPSAPTPAYQLHCLHAPAPAEIRGGMGPATQEQEATPRSSNANSRRHVRLFGVNLECQLSESSFLSTQQQQGYQYNYFDYNEPHTSNHYSQHQLDMNFPQGEGVNQMGNRLG